MLSNKLNMERKIQKGQIINIRLILIVVNFILINCLCILDLVIRTL